MAMHEEFPLKLNITQKRILKPGSDLAVITNTATRDTGTLTDHDVVVQDGTKDISRN